MVGEEHTQKNVPPPEEGARSEPAGPGPGFPEADSLIVFDGTGRIVDADEGACRDLGYPRDELLQLTIEDISSRQDAVGFARILRVIRSQGVHRLFGYNRRRDGSAYSVEASLWLEDRGGQERVVCSMRDAGPFQSLIEDRDQLIYLIENSSDAIVVASPEGRCSYSNPAALALAGFHAQEDVAGRSIVDFHPPREHYRLLSEILPAVRRGRWQGELSFQHRETEKETPCLTNAFPMGRTEDGSVFGLAFVAHDLTPRKAAEQRRERLLELNKISRKVATSLLERDDLHEPISIILEGVGKVLGVNRSFLCRYRERRRILIRTHQWNAAENEVLRLPDEAQSAEEYTEATDMLLRGEVIRLADVTESSLAAREDSPLLRTDVKAMLVLPVVIRGSLESFFGFIETQATREWEDEEVSVVQIIVDSFARAVERRIAERDRMEAEKNLEQALVREKRANRYKSDFLANMSHELRTPMNAIVGYAELLGRPHVAPENQAAWVQNIRKSTDHLLSLINDVLDISKIEAGQMTLEIEECDPAQLVEDVVALMKAIADEKLLEMRIEQPVPIPAKIGTDPVRFKQILINLVGNAIKYTPRGGITVRFGIAAEGEEGAGDLLISVIDTGIGITPEALAGLFRPFAQVRERGGPRFGGTGLGLDISRQLARLLGGEIMVESEAGVGSTFTMRVALAPFADAVTSESRSASGGPPEGDEGEPTHLEGRRILIVDDSKDNREVLRFLLQEAGAACASAENGALGLRSALEADRSGKPFDVILMDVNMPVMNGIEATARLVASEISSPIIALTAMAMADDAQRCLDAGCVDYVSKPVVPRTFLRTIARHLPEREEVEETSTAPGDTPDAPVFSLADNPRFAPLIKRYVGSFPTQVENIRAAYDRGQLDEVRTLVHRIRGTASNYGFPEVTAAAGVCEDSIRDRAGEEVIGAALEKLLGLLSQLAER